MADREIRNYYWTWRDGDEWPSWCYGEKVAKEVLERTARQNPGCRVLMGTLCVEETCTLPDKLVRERC